MSRSIANNLDSNRPLLRATFSKKHSENAAGRPSTTTPSINLLTSRNRVPSHSESAPTMLSETRIGVSERRMYLDQSMQEPESSEKLDGGQGRLNYFIEAVRCSSLRFVSFIAVEEDNRNADHTEEPDINASIVIQTGKAPPLGTIHSTDGDRDHSIVDPLAEGMRFHNTPEGRQYVCGIFLLSETARILTALNRGSLVYKSAKYDEKFSTTLIDTLVKYNATVEESILRDFIGGEP